MDAALDLSLAQQRIHRSADVVSRKHLFNLLGLGIHDDELGRVTER
jgi:hypothetical protein